MTVDHPTAATTAAGRRQVLTRRIRMLVTTTISYNVIEAAVALTAGTQASSTALIGFGLDSVIEVSSAAAVAWQFSARPRGPGEDCTAGHRAVVLRPGRLRQHGIGAGPVRLPNHARRSSASYWRPSACW